MAISTQLQLGPLLLLVALIVSSCDPADEPDAGAEMDSGSMSLDSGMDSVDAGPMMTGADAGDTGDAGGPADAGRDAGSSATMALPSGGLTTLGSRSTSETYRIFDEGFETDTRLCNGDACITGSIRP